MWSTPSRRRSVATEARSSAAAAANRSRRCARRGVDADLAAGLGVDERQLADVGEVGFAGVAISIGDDVMPGGAGRPAVRDQSRGPRKSETRTTRPPRGAAAFDDPEGRRPARWHRPPSSTRRRRRAPRAAAPSSPWRPARGRHPPVARPPNVTIPSAVAPLGREVADRQRDALGDVRLAAVGGAEGHRRRDVEQEPRGQGTLGDVDPDVRDRRPGGDVPVDPADVVARLVRPDLGELGATAEVVRPVVAGQQAADPPPDGQVERAEQRLGRRPGPGTLPGPAARGRRRAGETDGHADTSRSSAGGPTATEPAPTV